MSVVTTVSLTVSKTTFTLLIGITNAIAVFLSAILPFYLPSAILSPTILFVDAISNILIIYLTTEETEISEMRDANGLVVWTQKKVTRVRLQVIDRYHRNG